MGWKCMLLGVNFQRRNFSHAARSLVMDARIITEYIWSDLT